MQRLAGSMRLFSTNKQPNTMDVKHLNVHDLNSELHLDCSWPREAVDWIACQP